MSATVVLSSIPEMASLTLTNDGRTTQRLTSSQSRYGWQALRLAQAIGASDPSSERTTCQRLTSLGDRASR